jgi:hypothetical protein
MSSTKVITGKVRFSYANVFIAKASKPGQPERFGSSILIPKTDKKTIAAINAAVEAAIALGKASKFGGKVSPTLKKPLRDGDEEKPDDENYAGMMFLNASSNSRPGIVDVNCDPIMNRDEFYSGCYGRASLNFYPYFVDGSKGIAAGLNNVMKLEDGPNLGGGSASAADDFGDRRDDDLI